jgi:hypothetical protein
MTTEPFHYPSHREIVADVMTRLARVHAAGDTIKSLATARETPDVMLTDALQALEHDLRLALHAAQAARERIRP